MTIGRMAEITNFDDEHGSESSRWTYIYICLYRNRSGWVVGDWLIPFGIYTPFGKEWTIIFRKVNMYPTTRWVATALPQNSFANNKTFCRSS